jgi:hypothetical protein
MHKHTENYNRLIGVDSTQIHCEPYSHDNRRKQQRRRGDTSMRVITTYCHGDVIKKEKEIGKKRD